MHTAPSSSPTSPDTTSPESDYHVVTDLTSSIESLSLSSATGSCSRRSSSTSEDYEVILAAPRRDSDLEASGVLLPASESDSTPSEESSEEDSEFYETCPTPQAAPEAPPRIAQSLRPIAPRSAASKTSTSTPRSSVSPNQTENTIPTRPSAPTPTSRPIDFGDVSESDSDSSTDTERPSRSNSGSSYPYAPSISSASEAKESIDSFFSDPGYTSVASNKLRLWQALCIEFGLVDLDDDSWASDSDSDSSDGRSATPTHRVPLPTSLTKARALLSAKAHVNINEYRQARSDPCREVGFGAYADLVYPSTRAMMKSTRKSGNFAKLKGVKGEWLNPLLRTFNH